MKEVSIYTWGVYSLFFYSHLLIPLIARAVLMRHKPVTKKGDPYGNQFRL